MNAEPPTCPYCNAQAPAGARGKVICPRCGEMFTLQNVSDAALQLAPPTFTTRPESASSPEPGKPIRANRLVAGLVLGVMTLMAATGLTFALMTVSVRREHDKAVPRRPRKVIEIFRKPEPEPVEAVAAVQLAGLGYLPAGTNVAAGVQVEELLRSRGGKEMTGRTLTIGSFELKLDSVKERLGLGVEEIDHLVLGVHLRELNEADLTPPTYLVVRTRQPYDAARVRAALQAARPNETAAADGKRLLVAVKVKNLPLPVQLWCADERTLVLGLFTRMEELPLKPSDGPSRLEKDVRDVLEQRVGAGAPFWLAGHHPNWKKTVLPTLLEGFKEVPVLDQLPQVRTFAIWLQPDQPPKWLGAFRCAKEADARQIEQQELAPQAKANPTTFKFSRDKEWLSVQIQANKGEK